MIPLRDSTPTRHFPVMNYLLILVNVLVFVFQWLAGSNQSLSLQFAMVPATITRGDLLWGVVTIFTSMFMHAGLVHIGGNMLYLWIFGDNVEDSLGSGKYLLFYLTGGVIASVVQILVNPTSTIPTVGASGAIAAVLGAYLILFPHSKVLTFIPVISFLLPLSYIPATIVLGSWFLLQLFDGLLALGGPDVGGVAFWAHIGGFVAGVVIARFLVTTRRDDYSQQW